MNKDLVLRGLQYLIKQAIAATNSPLSIIKTVYIGDPGDIASSNLPAITIGSETTEFIRRGSQYDSRNREISIKLILNISDNYSDTNEDYEVVKAKEDLSYAIEGIDETHQAIENTLARIIQNNPCIQYVDESVTITPANDSRVLSVNYGETDRSETSYEADVRILVNVVVNR